MTTARTLARAEIDHPCAMEWPDIPGVSKVEATEGRMTVHFADGKTATVEPCPMARMFGGDTYNVYLPPDERAPKGIAGKIMVSKKPAEVVAILTEMARAAL